MCSKLPSSRAYTQPLLDRLPTCLLKFSPLFSGHPFLKPPLLKPPVYLVNFPVCIRMMRLPCLSTTYIFSKLAVWSRGLIWFQIFQQGKLTGSVVRKYDIWSPPAPSVVSISGSLCRGPTQPLHSSTPKFTLMALSRCWWWLLKSYHSWRSAKVKLIFL